MSSAASAPSPSPAASRLARIDVLRGLALLVMYWDHVMVLNGISSIPLLLTPHFLAFWDFGEVFVFLSGCSFFLAFEPLARRAGLGAALARAVGRSLQIYSAHLVTFALTLAAVTAVALRIRAVPWAVQGFFADPIPLLPAIARLTYLPAGFGILPLYMLLVPFGVLQLALARRGPALPAALSLGLWLSAQVFPDFSPTRISPEGTGDGRWWFNPLAWQLLFTSGLLLARARAEGRGVARAPRWLDLLALALTLASPAIKIGGALAVAPDALTRLDWGPALSLLATHTSPASAKPTLGPVRLISFAAALWLVLRFLPEEHAIWRGRGARLLGMLGRQSLQVFCLSTGFVLVGHSLTAATGGGLDHLLGWTALGALLCFGHARFRIWLDSWRSSSATGKQSP